MAEHSLEEARRRGFLAMQYNFVVCSNEDAVHLWQSLGFTVAACPAPSGIRVSADVDALVMFRRL